MGQAEPRKLEAELILACARVSSGAVEERRIEALLERPLDWDRLVQAAERHAVVPLLHRHLSSRGGVPAEVRRRLRIAAEQTARRNLFWAGELLRLLRRCEAEGIAALPWKGPTLALAAYGNLGLRPFTDLDVLVLREDVPSVTRLLLDEGYRPWLPLTLLKRHLWASLWHQCEAAFTHPRTGVVVDLHWAITLPSFPFPLEVASLWERREARRFCGAMVPQLAPVDSLLTLCVHGCKEYWRRLGWVCDIAALVQRNQDLIGGETLEYACELGAERMLLLGLFLAHELLDTTAPENVLKRARADRVLTRLARDTREQLFRESNVFFSSPKGILYHLRMRERRRDRFRYLFGQFLPRWADWVWIPLPRALAPLYFVLRPLRLLAKYAGLALHRGSFRRASAGNPA